MGNSKLSSKSLTFRVFKDINRVSELRSDRQIANIILSVGVVIVLLVPILAFEFICTARTLRITRSLYTRSIGSRWAITW